MVVGRVPPGVEELGAALEMLHTYSLIHDDLPALDNDDLRRGRPTCHKVFGEAIAILAGDALQTQLTRCWPICDVPPRHASAIIAEIAHATGTIDGMIGGQVMDLEAEHTRPDAKRWSTSIAPRLGALLTASVVTGGMYAGADESQLREPARFRHEYRAGVSDCRRRTRRDPDFGAAGQDRRERYRDEKATYPALFGIEASVKKADELVAAAEAALEQFGERAATLRSVAKFLVERKK